MTKLVENTDDVCTNLVMMAQELRQAIATNQTTLNAIGKNLADASGVLADKEIGWGAFASQAQSAGRRGRRHEAKGYGCKTKYHS